jgi:hypothetical protein
VPRGRCSRTRPHLFLCDFILGCVRHGERAIRHIVGSTSPSLALVEPCANHGKASSWDKPSTCSGFAPKAKRGSSVAATQLSNGATPLLGGGRPWSFIDAGIPLQPPLGLGGYPAVWVRNLRARSVGGFEASRGRPRCRIMRRPDIALGYGTTSGPRVTWLYSALRSSGACHTKPSASSDPQLAEFAHFAVFSTHVGW